MAEGNQTRLVGINHVAIEVGDIDEALAWYGRIFDFTLRGKGERNAFIDMGDQFINLTLVPDYAVTASRSAISALSSTTAAASSIGGGGRGAMVEGPSSISLSWGNRIEVIEYPNIQFTKAPHVCVAWASTSPRTTRPGACRERHGRVSGGSRHRRLHRTPRAAGSISLRRRPAAPSR